jgi:membrane dipeptidase
MIKKIFIAFIAIISFKTLAAQNAQRIHNKAILVDTHNDILEQCIGKHLSFDQNLKGKTQTDLVRLKQGGVDAQFFSVWCDGHQINPYAFANAQMDTLDAVINRNPDKIVKVGNYNELKKAIRQHKIAAMFGVEGGHMIEDDLNKLDSIYNRGARYMTLTWNNSTSWATSAFEETRDTILQKRNQKKGLNDFGKQVVKRMNELGMMVDISHVGEQTFWDVISTTIKPVVASHSSVYNLCPVPRNLKDDQIKAIAKNGGVIQVNFYSGFIDSSFERRSTEFALRHKTERDSILKINPERYYYEEYLFKTYPEEVKALRPPLEMLLQHFDYIIKLVGVDYVGIGSDFDGISSSPQQMDDVTSYPILTKALLDKGYSKKDVTKILGGNVLRVLKANEKK